jgi:hypothetical protein
MRKPAVRVFVARRTSKLIASALIACQLAFVLPVRLVAESPREDSASATPEQTIRLNRTVPQVTAAALTPQFSADPTDDELFHARIFEEPLIPSDAPAVSGENQALARALQAYLGAGGRDALGSLRSFLATYGSTRWRASLLTSIGLVYRRTGHLSRALRA